MSTPVISVIVPVYKVEKNLAKCIDSILAQTYTNLEIILVDDGSPDRCPEICDYYAKKDLRIKVIHKQNGGLSSARNAGLDQCTGDYISFIDSDDYIAPKMYEKLMFLIQQTKADLSICGYTYVDDIGTPVYVEGIQNSLKACVLNRNQALHKLYGADGVYYVTAVNKLYSRALFDCLRFEEGRIHEDEFIVHHIFDRCKLIAVTGESLYYYVQREASIMHQRFSKKKFDAYFAMEDRAKFFLDNNMQDLFLQTERSKLSHIRNLTVKMFLSTLSCKEKRYWMRLFQKEVITNFSYMTQSVSLREKVLAKLFCVSPILYFIAFIAKKLLSRAYRSYQSIIAIVRLIINVMYAKTFHKGHYAFLLMTLLGGNLGDQAITIAESQLFSKIHFVEMPCENMNSYVKHIKLIKKLIGNEAILFTGGGYLGTLWYPSAEVYVRKIIKEFPHNPIILLPNTCYYENTLWGDYEFEKSKDIYNTHNNLKVFVREAFSYELIKKCYKNVILIPDMVMFLDESKKNVVREGVLLCLRHDLEKSMTLDQTTTLESVLRAKFGSLIVTDTVIQKKVSRIKREKEVKEKLKQFQTSELVVTDRLHGMIFAAITGTPCIVLKSKSHKLQGCYEWIKKLEYIRILDSIEDVDSVCCEIVGKKFQYDNSEMKKYFDELRDYVYSVIIKEV